MDVDAGNGERAARGWSRYSAALRTTLAVLLPLLAVAAPLLTGAYYLLLASGSATAARQMMLLSDPVNTALSLTIAFLPAMVGAAAVASVLISRGKFPVPAAYLLVLLAVIVSGSNLDPLWWGLLGLSSMATVLPAWFIPGEYVEAKIRAPALSARDVDFRGRRATWLSKHVRAEWLALRISLALYSVNVLVVLLLTAGLFVAQFVRPPVYQLAFEGIDEPIDVVWFSFDSAGTWYVTEYTSRDVAPDAVFGVRDLEWSPNEPASIIACGLSAAVCG